MSRHHLYSYWLSFTRTSRGLTVIFLCILLAACSTAKEQNIANQQLNEKLDKHLNEWQSLKPAIERLIKSEQDLKLVIDELDKLSTLENKPNDQQLNSNADFSPPIAAPLSSPSSESNTASMEFGIHLASYLTQKHLVLGWYIYQKKHHNILLNKKAMMQLVNISGTQYHRLIAAPYDSKEQALAVCASLKEQQQFCQVVSYSQP